MLSSRFQGHFSVCAVKLDAAKVRVTLWILSTGLSVQALQSRMQAQLAHFPLDEVPVVYHHLETIFKAFEDTLAASNGPRSRLAINAKSEETLDLDGGAELNRAD